MFSKLTLVVAASMAVFVAALPRPGGSGSINNSCNGGTQQCCNSYAPSDSSAVQDAAKTHGFSDLLSVLAPAAVTAGLTCTPVSVLALAGQSCSQQSACCTGNNFEGAVVLGCDPIAANL